MKNIGYRDLELIDELERITGINPCSIDFDDPEVMKIFQMKQDSELMMDCCNIPGFDYAYINKILKVVNPKHFDDLVTVMGIASAIGSNQIDSESLIIGGEKDLLEVIGTSDVAEKISDIYCAVDDDRGHICAFRTVNESEHKNLRSTKMHQFSIATFICAMQNAWRLAWYKLHYPLEFYKTMIDVRYNDVDFRKIIADMEKIATDFKNMNSDTDEFEMYMNKPIIRDSAEDLVEYYNLFQKKERYPGYQFFLKYYSEGYQLLPKEVCGPEFYPCEIDRNNNAIIVHVRN